MSYQPISEERTVSKTMIAAGIVGVSACFALGMAVGSSVGANSQMYTQPAVQTSTSVQPMAALHQMNQGFATRAQAYPAQSAETQGMPVYDVQALPQTQAAGWSRIGLLAFAPVVAAAAAFLMRRTQPEESIALAPYSSESMERRKKLIAQENARRKADGLSLINTWNERSRPVDEDEERRQKLRMAHQEYVQRATGRAPAPTPAPSRAPASSGYPAPGGYSQPKPSSYSAPSGGRVDPDEERRRKLIAEHEAFKRSLGKGAAAPAAPAQPASSWSKPPAPSPAPSRAAPTYAAPLKAGDSEEERRRKLIAAQEAYKASLRH